LGAAISGAYSDRSIEGQPFEAVLIRIFIIA
jgi:hypothetical protein